MGVEAIACHWESTFCALREAASSSATASERVKRAIFIFSLLGWQNRSLVRNRSGGSQRNAPGLAATIKRAGQARNRQRRTGSECPALPGPVKTGVGIVHSLGYNPDQVLPRPDLHGQ